MAFRPKILVVEEDPALQQLLASTMHQMGADVLCLQADHELKLHVETEKLDGVFVDWDNQNMNPEDLTRSIRKSKSNSGIPVTMLSARRDQTDVGRGFKAGASFFLAKPFGTKELEHLLNATRGAMLEERRRYTRRPASIPILCEWKAGRNTKHITGRSIDISTTGALLKLTPRPDAGVGVALELPLPKPETKLNLKGVVVRTGPGENVAIRFIQLTVQHREQLENFVVGTPPSPSLSDR